MRALWTAATGMKSQQLSIDLIANNMANVNTVGYKKQQMQFKDLLYANIRQNHLVEGQGSPVQLQMGHGVMPTSTARLFSQGNLEATDNPLDVAIDGEGFFVVEGPDGRPYYTRDGAFKLSVDGEESALVTSDGYFLMSEFDDLIIIGEGMSDLTISTAGVVTARNQDDEIEELGTLKMVRFINPQGLEARGQNLFSQTVASGDEIPMEGETRTSMVRQNYLEMSNVQIVDEMVRMITAQRAYETSSRVIQTSDEMMGMANNLRR